MRFAVSPEKQAELEKRMAELGIREEDLEEKFVRAGGPGGQKVNKTATAVQLKHLPTGTEVRVQTARSQSLNRFYARRLLVERLETARLGEESPEQKRIAKLRKQKDRRRRRTSF